MPRTILNINDLSASEMDWYLKETWCDKCGKADLGMNEPVLYVENGKEFIEGKCTVCGETVKTQIVSKGENS